MENAFRLNELVSYILLKSCSLKQLVKGCCCVSFFFFFVVVVLKDTLKVEKKGLVSDFLSLLWQCYTLPCPGCESEVTCSF